MKMPRPLVSAYVQLTVAAPVQSATAVAPVPSGASSYRRRTIIGVSLPVNEIAKLTPAGKSLRGSSETTVIGC
jgi:hypothetical protein